MKVALIPPLGWESYLAQSTGVLMALALENCMDSPNYPANMRLVKNAGKAFLILDNGAAEGQQAKNGTVNKFAREIGANEIVVPDVMGSRQKTIAKAHEFFRYTKWDPAVSYMGVVQGDSIKHAQQCVRDYAEIVHRRLDVEAGAEMKPITTLGIPRRLIQVTEEFSARIDLANWILNEYGRRFEIHFLGAATVWPHEVKYATKYAPLVRSIDTSLPFVFAHHGVDLAATTARPQTRPLERPTGYMVGNLVNRNVALVQSNIDTYLTWARG